MSRLGRQRPGQTASQVQRTPEHYTASSYDEPSEIYDLVVIERGGPAHTLPSQLQRLPSQYFCIDDSQRIARWPSVTGAAVALVLSRATISEKATVTHLLYSVGALRVDIYRVEECCS